MNYNIKLIFFLFTLSFLINLSCHGNEPASIRKAEIIKTLKERTYLKKNWKFTASDNEHYKNENFDDSLWENMDFPVINFSFDNNKSNFFWFRKKFFVTESLKGESLGFSCGKLPDAAQIFLNGSLIGTSGSMPPANYFGTPAIPRSYILPAGLLNYDRENLIAMRIFTQRSYGDLKLPFITNNEDRLNIYFFEYYVGVLIPMIIMFLCILVAIYFFLMFMRNRKEQFNLYICLALLFFSVYASGLFIESLPVSYHLIIKIWYTSLFLSQMFFAFYFQEFYNIHSNLKTKLFIAAITSICCLMLLFSNTISFSYFLIYKIFMLTFATPMNFYMLILSIMAIINGNKYAKILIAGVSIVILTGTHDIIYVFSQMEPLIWLTNSGIVLYILSMFLTSANRFVDTKKVVDKLNKELIQQKNAFFRFVPTQFLSLLGKQSAIEISLGDSSLRNMSVLFSDIRKFTTMSEKMSPEESFHLLNSVLLRMESPINRNEGFVDKYQGDAIMALFSEVSLTSDEHNREKTSADKAVTAAVGMRIQLEEFNKYHNSNNSEILDMGIGINTGPLMLGTVGSAHRLDTTVIGDSVNLASRLEKLTEYYHTPIIISKKTYSSLSKPESLLVREIDLVQVKGKTELCTIYEVFEADPEEVKEAKIKTIDILATGIDRYKKRKFREALTYFKEARNINRSDFIPAIYIKRCVEYLKTPPKADWNGVFKVHN